MLQDRGQPGALANAVRVSVVEQHRSRRDFAGTNRYMEHRAGDRVPRRLHVPRERANAAEASNVVGLVTRRQGSAEHRLDQCLGLATIRRKFKLFNFSMIQLS